MHARPAVVALACVSALLSTGDAALAQVRPATETVIRACAPDPGAAFGARGGAAAARVARCALRELRTADRPTRQDAGVRRAALAAIRLARVLEGGNVKANRDRATQRLLDRFRCTRAAKGARLLIGDTATAGMRTPRELIRSIARAARTSPPAPLLGRATRLAVVTATGRVFAGGAAGGAAIAVAGATCTAG